MTTVGRERRLKRILGPRPSLIVPVDDSLIAGAVGGLEDLRTKITQIVAANPDALLIFKGALARFHDTLIHVPLILNITASTTRSSHTRKVVIGSVEEALHLGADGVAVHINLSSRFESEMLRNAGQISSVCMASGMPMIAIVYPRREGSDGGDDNYQDLRSTDRRTYIQLVSHAARLGMELGADIVKVPFTGDVESFASVVAAAAPVPVLIAGGPRKPLAEILLMARQTVSAGGAGVSFGRNIFGGEDAAERIREVRAEMATALAESAPHGV
jgi:DhnA family fructose-bisphosphate aldolase class Ia